MRSSSISSKIVVFLMILPAFSGCMEDSVKDPFELEFSVDHLVGGEFQNLRIVSSDRATRTAGIPVISSSTRIPYDVDVVEGPITGSALVYFDGDFPGVPESNKAPPQSSHSLAHNLIAAVTEVNEMVFGFMFTGIVENTCGEICTFEAEW